MEQEFRVNLSFRAVCTRVAKYRARRHGPSKKNGTWQYGNSLIATLDPNEQNVGRPLHLLTKLSEHLTCLDAKPNSKYVHWYVLALCASTTRYSKKIDGE